LDEKEADEKAVKEGEEADAADADAKNKKKDAEKETKGEKKPEDKKDATKTSAPEALTQVKGKDGEAKKEKGKDDEAAPAAPEKVHVIEWEEYKEKADTNTPNIRTTFYDKKSAKKAVM